MEEKLYSTWNSNCHVLKIQFLQKSEMVKRHYLQGDPKKQGLGFI